MSSIFSFLRGRGTSAVAATASAASLEMTQIVQQMVDHLTSFLPDSIEGLPDPTVTLVSLNDAPVGLGNHIGSEKRGSIGFADIKGGRLDAVVRFNLWGSNMQQVNDAMLPLQANLLAARAALWDLGFLQFTAITSSSPQFDDVLNAWSRTSDFSLLYEYRYEDDDAAQSLIARIPIHADQERFNSPDREDTVVTDEMARWDDLTAPNLLVQGPTTLSRLSALVFVTSDLPTGTVTITRWREGIPDPIQDYPSLTDFLNALAAPVAPERHGRVVFATFADFMDQFTPEGAMLHLGDWNQDTNPDEYRGLNLELAPPIQLQESFDRLEVMYGDGNESLDQVAVIYLKIKN